MRTKDKDVAAIIVTYNRKKDLLRCVKAVLAQSYMPENLIVVDNASSDGTLELLKEDHILDDQCVPEYDTLISGGQIGPCTVWYCLRPRNTGGSGGFCIGLKQAFKCLHASFYWLMDDDGYPAPDCLERLIRRTDDYDYIMPVSIDADRHEKLSWAVRKKDGKKTEEYRELLDSWGDIMTYATPFNGVLLSKKCVSEAGYVDERFFLWGDEYEHYWRCRQKGFVPVTLLRARFYHPSQKLPLVPILKGAFRVPYVDSPLRMICLARNYTYIALHYHQIYKIPARLLLYTWLYLITRHGDFRGWKLYLLSVKDGITGDFSRHWKYLGK